MPHFYFIVHDGRGESPDSEGADLPSLEAAIVHAAAGARSIMAESVKAGEIDLTSYIDIEDEYRVVVARVPYADVLKIIR